AGPAGVSDAGRGTRGAEHKQSPGRSAAETVMTALHAGGRFGGGGYKVSGGLHGVGVSVVTALSTRLELEVHRDGGCFTQSFRNGGEPAGRPARARKAHRPAPTAALCAGPRLFPAVDPAPPPTHRPPPVDGA